MVPGTPSAIQLADADVYRGVPQSVSFVVRNTRWVSLWLEQRADQPTLSGISWELDDVTPVAPQVLQSAPPQLVWDERQGAVHITLQIRSVDSTRLGPRTLVVESKPRRESTSVTETATITLIDRPDWLDW